MDNTYEKYCPSCKHYQIDDHICSRFGFNVPLYPDKFVEKCNGVYFSAEGSDTIARPETEKKSFGKVFSSRGRITRTEYIMSDLIFFLYYEVRNWTSHTYNPTGEISALMIFVLILSIAVICFIITQGTKRCHDIGRSGYWQLVPFFWFAMIFFDGDEGENRYGPDPKGRQAEEKKEEVTEVCRDCKSVYNPNKSEMQEGYYICPVCNRMNGVSSHV